MAKEKSVIDDNIHWYKDAIIYELHIKAFKDSSGDGIGDFKGLLEKLDYLEDLGVTAIWLLPFYPSPLRDDGYDIADYYNINPSYGDINDLKAFIKEAHRRGLRVITELVINHTSDQHPWFQRARRAKPGTNFRDFYVWSDDPNKYKDVRIIFTDTERSNWTWDPVANAYYWHRFFSHQPDLNYDNPNVQKEVFKMLDYWLNMGVDGFRLDAVPYLFEREGTNGENLPETHAFLKKLRAHVDKHFPGKLLLAEANMWPEDSAAYFGDGDECHMNYHFPIMPRMFMAVKMEDRYPITDIIDQTPEIPETCQWAIFLRNHDELTLEMVTDEERDYMYKVYAKDPQARINLGIRHRLAPLLDNSRKKIELMNTLLFSLPGTPVVYYGDEIGMGDNYYLGDRDGVRTPMQWSVDRNAGFSSANPHQLYLPVIIDPEYKYESVNVETQQKNLSSLLWWMKRVIAMRKRFKAFSRGDIKFLSPANAKVLTFTRTYENETILVIANLSRFSQAVELDLPSYKGFIPIEVFSQNRFPAIKEEPYLFTLGSHAYYWFLLQDERVQLGQGLDTDTPQLNLTTWESMVESANMQRLQQKVLPAYIKSCRWFGGKARTVQSMKVLENIAIPFNKETASMLIVEVSYNEGLPEMYMLPIAFATGDLEKKLRDGCPKSVIATISVKGEKGVLYDAVYNEEFQGALFTMMAKKRRLKDRGDAELVFYAAKETESLLKQKGAKVTSRLLSAEQSNTSITFENTFFLKLYRKLDRVLNPDVEISQYLTDKATYSQTPRFIGAIEHQLPRQAPISIGMMQEMVPNQGDAWEYFSDSLQRYFERVLSDGHFKDIIAPVGNLSEPVSFEDTPPLLQNLIGGAYVERVHLLGRRTAELHLALAAHPDEKNFEPEAFSLHYQRSLYSSLQSLVRGSYQSMEKNMKNLPANVKAEAEEVLSMRNDILKNMQRIFAHKIDTDKIRTHGDYHLGQVLFTGKDFVIIDFEGEPARSFSERRLKRSPLRDVAGMIRSFHYAAYNALLKHPSVREEDTPYLVQWAEQWYHYISGYYLKSYLEYTSGQNFIPKKKEDFDMLLQVFLLEKAVYELGYELNNRPDWVLIPIKGIKSIMSKYLMSQEKNKK
ncbi:maltose alpha-D-glucosyltransferase [Rhodocytophaga aerolata]|uniref:Maltokinase n=1 Tax=Rhodocytophaga aerolata TaxID=455078 RepID=A0ABT8R0J8_9BACT|nr:maltose alpha-D-glucosyltransferase [Rhodocytophaga aerolata]MDO1445611.1 maltose alpha-D-glucosyltransferase [Rhodocytophaga aerolata]